MEETLYSKTLDNEYTESAVTGKRKFITVLNKVINKGEGEWEPRTNIWIINSFPPKNAF